MRLIGIDLYTREILELQALDNRWPDSKITVRCLCQAMVREKRTPQRAVHDRGTHFLKHFPQTLDVLEIEDIKIPPMMPIINGIAERAIKTVRFELTNHIRPSSVEELQWYLDEFKEYYNHHRLHEALGGQTPTAFGRNENLADVVDLNEFRKNSTIERRTFANGLLSSYELAA